MKYTIQVTSNHKRYPKKFLILVQKIQSTCLEIYDSLMRANRLQLQLNTEKAERLKLQTEAITLCDELSWFYPIVHGFEFDWHRYCRVLAKENLRH